MMLTRHCRELEHHPSSHERPPPLQRYSGGLPRHAGTISRIGSSPHPSTLPSHVTMWSRRRCHVLLPVPAAAVPGQQQTRPSPRVCGLLWSSWRFDVRSPLSTSSPVNHVAAEFRDPTSSLTHHPTNSALSFLRCRHWIVFILVSGVTGALCVLFS